MIGLRTLGRRCLLAIDTPNLPGLRSPRASGTGGGRSQRPPCTGNQVCRRQSRETRKSPNPGQRRRRSEARQCLCRSPRRPGSTAFPGATAATLGTGREDASRVGSSAPDPDECLVAQAIARACRGDASKRSRGSAGSHDRSPSIAIVPIWRIGRSKLGDFDRAHRPEIVSSAKLILVISTRVSDLSADPPDACSRAAGQLNASRRPSPARARPSTKRRLGRPRP
jgi:hypothetical protein